MPEAQETEWDEVVDGESFGDEVFDDEAVERPFMPPRRPEPPDEATRTADKPVSNTEAIPLFPGSNKSQAKRGKQIKVTKLDPPHHGVKGFIPIGSTELLIAQQWGDGTYTLEILNNKGVALQTLEAHRIAMGYAAPDTDDGDDAPSAVVGLDANDAIRQLNAGHAQERARSAKLHADLLQRTADMASEHTKMVMDSTDKAQAREEKFFEAGQTRTEKFFETILTSTTAAHEREMARTTAENTASLERLRIEQAHKEEMNELRHVQLMEIISGNHKRELEMVEASVVSDEDPGVKMLTEGVKGLKELRLAAEHAGGRKVPGSARQPGRRARRRGLRAGGNSGGEPSAPTREKPKSARSTSGFARDLAALKRECENKGIDFRDLIVDAREQVQEHPGVQPTADGETKPTSGDSNATTEDGVGPPS